MTRRAARLILALALGGAGSCIDSTSPRAGPLTVSLTTPNAGLDGAILLTVTGPSALTSVTAAPGLHVFAEPLSATNHFAVLGPLPNGAILTIGVTDVNQASQYVATIQDVAATTYQLRTLSAYSLRITP
ncbi:MAG TPA: hypothetical protein VEU55_04445 [Gemmatimonadales bacterium]|nr:hypothetical protein [Gemmatimonadales bacterium]